MGIRCGKKLYANGNGSYMWHCPGCGMLHAVGVEKPNACGAQWTFNRNGDTPTFAPSVLVTWDKLVGDGPLEQRERVKQICHCFVKEGMIEFLGDCTHSLAGQTVPMPDWED